MENEWHKADGLARLLSWIRAHDENARPIRLCGEFHPEPSAARDRWNRLLCYVVGCNVLNSGPQGMCISQVSCQLQVDHGYTAEVDQQVGAQGAPENHFTFCARHEGKRGR